MLGVLDDNFSVQPASDRIVRNVVAFQRTILSDSNVQLTNLDHKLEKLRAWCGFGPTEMADLHNAVVAHINAFIFNLVEFVDKFDTKSLQQDINDAPMFIANVKLIQETNLSSHGLQVKRAEESRLAKLDQLEHEIQAWKKEGGEIALCSSADLQKDKIESFKIQIEALSTLSLHTCQDFALQQLNSLVITTLAELVEQVAGAMARACREFSEHLVDFFENQVTPSVDLEEQLSNLKLLSSIFSVCEEGKMVCALYASLLEDVSSTLRTNAGKWDQMPDCIRTLGVRDGKCDAALLMVFQKMRVEDQNV